MKQATERFGARCPIYDSVQQLLQPNAEPAEHCSPACLAGPNATLPSALQAAGYALQFFATAADLPARWDSLAAGRDQVFLSRNYLLAFEEARPEGFQFAYGAIERSGQMAGIMAFQCFDFQINQNLHLLQSAEASRVTRLTGQLLGEWSCRILACGATQVTGDYGFAFAPEVPSQLQAKLLLESLEAARFYLARDGQRPEVSMIKDITKAAHPALSRELEAQRFHAFGFEPNLVLEVAPGWRTLDDYLEAMTSKYRVRARRAFKKGAQLRCRSFTLADLCQWEARMHELYLSVARGADFSLVQLPPGYFRQLKSAFGNHYKVVAYFDGEELVGFCTVLKSGRTAEAHFLGFDEAYNATAQLYLNMLLESVRIGIEDFGAQKISFGRTATAIKSSIGARPTTEQVYLRHHRRLLNGAVPRLVQFLQPAAEEEPLRHPFG